MRYLLLTLLILAAPLLAQEAEEKEPAKPAEPKKKKEDKADWAAEIHKLVETLCRGKDQGELEELEKRLHKLLKDDFLTWQFEPYDLHKALGVFVDGTQQGQETITGTSDGTSYTLKSLGGGRYKLTATRKVRDDETQQITDEGTLKELRKKYAFLKGMLAVGWYGGATPWLLDYRQASKPRLGMLVRPPSEVLAYHLELPTGAGLVVGSVVKGSRAEKLGLKEHDVLLRIDGELIDSPGQLRKLEKHEGVLEYVRRGKPRKLDLAKVDAEEK